MIDEDPRAALARLKKEHRVSYAELSRMLRRNSAYIHQFVTRGSPAKLEEQDRRMLANFFGVDERVLGGPAQVDAGDQLIWVPRLMVEASAGHGATTGGERVLRHIGFDPAWLRQVCQGRPEDLSIIGVRGDSMAPTLVDGDDVLVNRADAGNRLRDGIYVLRRDDTLMIKRLALAPTSGTLTISSDNPAYPTWRDCPLDSITTIGRVAWSGRRFG